MSTGALLIRHDIVELNDGNVAEFPVAKPPGWDAVSLYYAKALQQMGWKNPTAPDGDVESTWEYSENPASYYFQAAMHETPRWPGTIPPEPYGNWWTHCTHESRKAREYFLGWHRPYIYWFEVIVRSYVTSLGGPEQWALPYWNYSHYDAGNPDGPWPRATLPWVFCQAMLPDGTSNPLYVPDTERRGFQPTWPGETPPRTMFLETLTPYYYEAMNTNDFFEFNATLDGRPHGAVHVDVGTGNLQLSENGWMASTLTAAFDPIFWVHHAHIDRFWVAWIANGNHNPPADSAWSRAGDDPMRSVRWNFWRDDKIDNALVIYPGQMADPSSLPDPFPHSYRYDSMPQTPAPEPDGLTARRSPGSAPEPPSTGQAPLVAATTAIQLESEVVSISLDVAGETAGRLVLRLDRVVAERAPGNYEIYLNYPEANRETAGSVPQFVGLLPGFGADHHRAGHDHGLSFRYDITDVVRYLEGTNRWDRQRATITFVPAVRPSARDLVIGPLRVGEISITTA